MTNGSYYFLSRPRRFGKSLTLSTIGSLFEGRRDLFRGLAIDSLDWDWKRHEVLHLDLNVQNYKDEDSLNAFLEWHLKKWEEKYGISQPAPKLESRISDIIIKACELSGRKVVVLIDEYDKPLLATIGNPELQTYFRKQLQGFYSVMKSMDRYLRFCMITGVSRFSKVSIFSALNNLEDISLDPNFNSICGVSESELTTYFSEGIGQMAEANGVSPEEMLQTLKDNYDGYHFAGSGEDIYNPFSLLNTLKSQRIGSYWLATGTTSSLLEVLNLNTYSIQDLEGFQCSENLLNGADIFLTDPVPFFFQTGYLTIKGFDPVFQEYTLVFPNREGTRGFSDLVLKTCMRNREPISLITGFAIEE